MSRTFTDIVSSNSAWIISLRKPSGEPLERKLSERKLWERKPTEREPSEREPSERNWRYASPFYKIEK